MESPTGPPTRRPAGRNARRIVALAAALGVGLAGYAGFVALTTPTTVTLVVYTYDSLLGGGCGTSNASVHDAVFGAFERAHRVHVELVCPQGTLVGTLAAEASAPVADAVIGLDEVTGPQAVALGLLAPSVPAPGVPWVPGLSTTLGAGGYLQPYEYGFLAIDVNGTFAAAHPDAVANWSFPAVAGNTSLAAALMIENPTTDITGEEFLLWEIAFSQQVTHRPWQEFWTGAEPHLGVAPDWTTAYDDFLAPSGAPAMVVSYSTDPAYAAFYDSGGFNSTVGRWNGSSYGWETVYGAGVVRGSAHPGLAEALVQWFDSGAVQSQLPLTEWEYPANASVPLPPAFDAAVPPDSIRALDAGGAGPLVGNLTGYLDDWQSIANGPG